MCGVDGSPGVVGRGNNGGGLYRVYPYCKKSLVYAVKQYCYKIGKNHTWR
jgi:hypothetical protein